LRRIMILICLLFLFSPCLTHANELFHGDVIVKWLNEPGGKERKMQLIKKFGYTDKAGKKWFIPEGWVIDGASIPKIFWDKMGSPYVGNYRRASVVHDYYCDIKTRSWQEVHKMFYEASIAGGTTKTKAKIMYLAILMGGPRWDLDIVGKEKMIGETRFPSFNAADYDELEKWIINNNPSPEEIFERSKNISN